jgi:hypothetical protein
MTDIELSRWLLAAALFNGAFALFHLTFWRVFGWPGTLLGSGSVNRSITQLLNLALTYFFALAAVLIFFFPDEIATSALGRFWLLGMAGFWLARGIVQPVFFSLRNGGAVLYALVFLLGAAMHGMAWLRSSGL